MEKPSSRPSRYQIGSESNLALAHFCAIHKTYNALFAKQFPTKQSLEQLQARRPEFFDWNARPPKEWLEAYRKAGQDGEDAAKVRETAQAENGLELQHEEEPIQDVVMKDQAENVEPETIPPITSTPPQPPQPQLLQEPIFLSPNERENESLSTYGPLTTRQGWKKRASTGPALPELEGSPVLAAKKSKSTSNRRSSARVKTTIRSSSPPPTKSTFKKPPNTYGVLELKPWQAVIRFCAYEQIRRRLTKLWGPSRLRYYPKLERDELDYDRLMMDCRKAGTSGNVWFISREVARRGYLERNLARGRKEKWRANLKL